MTQPGFNQIAAYRGKTVYDQQGDKIGKFQDIYTDIDTGEPEWIGIDSGGFLSSKHVLVPLQGFTPREDGISVPYTKDRVKDAPKIDEDQIGYEREAELYEYYGLRQAGLQQPTEAYDPGRARQPETGEMREGRMGTEARGQESMTRSEEEMRIGKRQTEAGRVRLRKWIESEPVSEDVTLKHETAYVEREPINQPTGGELREEELEMGLRQEEAVVQKETVARERVSLGKETEETTETIEEDLRRERIEAEGDFEDRRGV